MIRQAKIDDLYSLLPLCKSFANESENIRFKEDAWLKTWANLIENGIGTIFMLDDYSGFIGGICYPDPNTGDMTATEMFWYVDKKQRGQGLKLLQKFEQWAQQKNCRSVIMVHLTDLMPKALERVYKRRGYKEIEMHYLKEL